MKRLLPLLLVVLVALSAACRGSGFENAIVGEWEGTSAVDETVHSSTWEFFEDGTMIMTIHTGLLDTSLSFPGTYVFEDDDTITIREDGSETDAPPGRRDIRMPDDDTLILTAPVSGAQAVLKRVQE